MHTLEVTPKQHDKEMGMDCPFIEPNITDDCLISENGKVIGFYISDVGKYDDKLTTLLNIANKEFRSKRVPKQHLDRIQAIEAANKAGIPLSKFRQMDGSVSQYSTILGAVPKNPRLRRMFNGYSSVHSYDEAKTFVKAMMGASIIGMTLIKKLAPELHEQQLEAVKGVNDRWTFGKHFTSSISNYNISAPFHRDTRNIVNSLNIIYTKRANSEGGCLHVPEYNATFEQPDNSMLVYPAWKNMHGVTPIKEHANGGYRNSLIFYSLKAFIDDEN